MSTGQEYRFSSIVEFEDGNVLDTYIDWIAPAEFNTAMTNISIYQEKGLVASDDLVLLADGHGISRWQWISNQVNTSDR